VSLALFKATRDDGRSDSQVVVDLVRERAPGDLIPFEDIAAALAVGTDRTFDRQAVRSIVARSYVRVLKESSRALHSVRGEGYRIATANDHRPLARARNRRAETQLNRGLATLQNVAWDEMDPQSRQAHEGQLMLTSALVAQQRSFDRRLARVEKQLRAISDGKSG
jgi:hypothetical protein